MKPFWQPWFSFMISGGVVVMLAVHFLTPLSVAPIGPDGPDWITGIIAAFWWVVGCAFGAAIYGLFRFFNSK